MIIVYDVTFGELRKSILKFFVTFLQLFVNLRLFEKEKSKNKNKFKQIKKNDFLSFSLKFHLPRWGEM